MEHRRRGADFSHLLESFCSNATDCGTALDAISQEAHLSTETNVQSTSSEKTYDGDKRINTKNSNQDDSSESGSFKSTILAGQAVESDSQRSSESYQTARSGSVAGRPKFLDTSLESCQQPQIPSIMNRAITLEFSPQPELDLSQASTELRSSNETNRNVFIPSEKCSIESRDTNYNIKRVPLKSKTSEICQGLESPRNKFTQSTSRAFSVEHKDWTLLSRLDNVLDPSGDKSEKSKQKILRRLSQEFLYSPRTFTERLVTIIDETETGFADAETSGVSLSRMTKEFRKMCKFIQDESMPEMAPSLCMNTILGNSRYHDDNNEGNYERPETIVESPTESPSADCKTPQLENDVILKKIYRKTPLNIFRKTFRENKQVGSIGSPNTTREFEYWEKYCEGLQQSPILSSRDRPKVLRRSLSTSDISEAAKEELVLKCEEQLRSLDDTNLVEFETFDSHQDHGVKDGEIQRVLSNNDNAFYNETEDIRGNESCENYDDIYEDEFSNSLLIEKELQRKRCFETAILMQEIEEDAKKTKEEYPKALERRGIDPETAFMKTLNSCLAYKNCRSGIRQNSHVKRKEGSSVDSGIDIRSFGRTLYASSKKSFNEASARNSAKNKERSAGISPRLVTGAIKKADRKAVSSGNFYQGSANKVETQNAALNSRKKVSSVRPSRKSLTLSRSPSRGKRSPNLQTRNFNTRALKTPERNRKNIRVKSPVPDIVVSTPTKVQAGLNLQAKEIEVTNVPKSMSLRAKSPRSKFLSDATQGTLLRKNVMTSTPQQVKSPGLSPSPSVRKQSTERVPKLGNNQTQKPEKCTSSTKTSRSPRNRYFVTPGRNTPAKRTKKIKTYFTGMDDDFGQESSPRIMKSPHAPGLYRLGYETVISPVSMYIRGTDVNLIQNNRERKNEFMLTPNKVALEEKLKFNLASKVSPRDSPRTKCRLFVEKQDLESDENDENVQEPGFALPKASYNQPAEVRTVNESPRIIGGARTRGLLQSMQNRVIIRHESKIPGKFDDNNVPESGSDSPVNMSIHVLKSAEKTNFMSRNRRHL